MLSRWKTSILLHLFVKIEFLLSWGLFLKLWNAWVVTKCQKPSPMSNIHERSFHPKQHRQFDTIAFSTGLFRPSRHDLLSNSHGFFIGKSAKSSSSKPLQHHHWRRRETKIIQLYKILPEQELIFKIKFGWLGSLLGGPRPVRMDQKESWFILDP